jgi:hypothetical protein
MARDRQRRKAVAELSTVLLTAFTIALSGLAQYAHLSLRRRNPLHKPRFAPRHG